MRVLPLIFFWIFTLQIAISQHTNIVIDGSYSNNPNEPSIIMDPDNPQFIVAASNINNYYYSIDTGRTWQSRKLSSSYGVWGDPALTVDKYGSFYFFHLANPPFGNWIDRIVCQRSDDEGITWNNGSFTGLNGTKAQDKEWPTVDRKNNNIYLTWTQFDEYGSSNSSDSTHIMFSMSTDKGNNWSPAKRINQKGGDCIDDDDTVEGAVPAVGPNGEIYVSWAGPGGIVFDRSLDQGKTWLDQDIFVSANPGGWNYEIPGIYRANGLPVTTCDTSAGVYNGNIYINWTDQRNGPDDTDVWLVRSEDGGNSWSEPVRVNDDQSGRHQFFSWMDIDQTNGYIYIVFYDRRHYDNRKTDVYLAVSMDGGQTFKNHRISESPFEPNSGVFFGDYTNITVHNNIIRPIWTRLEGGHLKILTALVDFELLTGNAEIEVPENNMTLDQNYPNPIIQDTYISFKLPKADTLNLKVYDSQGKLQRIIFQNQRYESGKYIIKLSEQLAGLEKGLYHYVLSSASGQFRQKKMILLE
jgi:hypothetical protein